MASLDTILTAKTYTDLFPTTLDEKAAHKRYIRLQRITHPDLNTDEPQKAKEAFINLSKLWEERPFNNKPTTGQKANTVKTRKHTYLFTAKNHTTPDTVHYKATYDDGHQDAYIIFSRNPQKNSQFLNGIRTLTKIYKTLEPHVTGYFPKPADVFTFTNKTAQHSAAMVETAEPLCNLYTLQEILQHYPQGLNAKNVTWIYKRMLIALHETHKAGYVHGNVNLNAFLIHPERHGLILNEWSNVTEENTPFTEIPSPLPLSIKTAQAKPEIDISLAAHTAARLCNEKTTPSRFLNALKGTAKYPPKDAATALGELDDLNRELWGDPKWHELKMPVKN